MEIYNLVLENVTDIANGTSKVDDNDPRNFTFVDAEWASYVNPIILYILFYLLVLEAKELLKPEVSQISMIANFRLECCNSGLTRWFINGTYLSRSLKTVLQFNNS